MIHAGNNDGYEPWKYNIARRLHAMLKQGLYEQVVNKEMKEELNGFSDAEKHIEKIDSAEASSILTQYLSEVVRKGRI